MAEQQVRDKPEEFVEASKKKPVHVDLNILGEFNTLEEALNTVRTLAGMIETNTRLDSLQISHASSYRTDRFNGPLTIAGGGV